MSGKVKKKQQFIEGRLRLDIEFSENMDTVQLEFQKAAFLFKRLNQVMRKHAVRQECRDDDFARYGSVGTGATWFDFRKRKRMKSAFTAARRELAKWIEGNGPLPKLWRDDATLYIDMRDPKAFSPR